MIKKILSNHLYCTNNFHKIIQNQGVLDSMDIEIKDLLESMQAELKNIWRLL